MPWYSTGTVAVTNNSPTVTGTGTTFSANARVGDAFRGPDGLWYEVTNVASATVISIKPNYQGANSAAGSYAIAPMQGYVKDSADALRGFVNQYGAALAGLGPLASWQSGTPLVIAGSGVRIQSDFSSGDPTAFQTSATNTRTLVSAAPNGTATEAGYIVRNAAANTIASIGMFRVNASVVSLEASISGAATWLPLTFWTSGSERVRITPDGRLLVAATADIAGNTGNAVHATGTISATGGFRCRPGTNGTPGNVFNINWTAGSQAQLWIDGFNIGTLNITSDYRIKQDIALLDADFLDRIRKYEVVEYRLRGFGIWEASTKVFQGLIAHQAQTANPKAATGRKDEVDDDGEAVIQNLEIIPIVTDCIGAIQQLAEMVQSLQAELDALKSSAA
ncbi:tail fiber domain-containing protein [Pseudomonas denitrificans (nom. rej.)]|uniref:tail fiber domain-containing protein n=1 Tax=Pseudomonas denitrificans TaxID=43306 RepID=UPI00142ED46D|nr:tail fiber domain-containing protein [Pseudomonas denitrificans (nom. rej.)]